MATRRLQRTRFSVLYVTQIHWRLSIGFFVLFLLPRRVVCLAAAVPEYKEEKNNNTVAQLHQQLREFVVSNHVLKSHLVERSYLLPLFLFPTARIRLRV